MWVFCAILIAGIFITLKRRSKIADVLHIRSGGVVSCFPEVAWFWSKFAWLSHIHPPEIQGDKVPSSDNSHIRLAICVNTES